MNDLDTRINDDLGALAAETQQGIGELSDIDELVDQRSAYRDDRPGAEARRSALIDKRRLELALLPLASQQIFVHRVARASAGAFATLGAAALFVALWAPNLIRMADYFVPGPLTLPLITVGVAFKVLAVYVIAGWIAARYFERRMRESLEVAGDDVYEDIEALAHGPMDHARELLRKVDGWSVSLPLLGVATLAPVLALMTVGGVEGSMYGFGFARYAGYVDLDGNLILLAVGIGVGACIALAIGRACDRSHRTLARPLMLRIFEHVGVIGAAVVAGLIALAILGEAFRGLQFGHLPTGEVRLALAVIGTVAVTAAGAWAMLWNRRREKRRLELATRRR